MTLTPDQNRALAARVREAMARRRISRQKLADEARISVSTLEKALAGDRPFSLASLVRIEQALAITLRQAPDASPQVAPPELGSYVRSAVAHLEGEYLTLRPAFEAPGGILAYCTLIAWDEERRCLRFGERERVDPGNAQTGFVSLPPARGKVYLSTTEGGEMRLAILNSPARSGELSGALLTLTAGTVGLPASTPIVLVPRRPEHQFGRFVRGDVPFVRYQTMLAEARKSMLFHDVPA
jgi:transcriptional regulator with XRE-family HTH domain